MIKVKGKIEGLTNCERRHSQMKEKVMNVSA